MAENGAMFPEKSDIDSLIDKLKAFFDERSSDESAETPKQSIPTKPKYTDLNRMVGDLGIAVPTGFWLIHNDLEDISKQLKGSGGGSAPSNLSWEDVANNLVSKLPALAGILAGAVIVNTIVKNTSMDDLIRFVEVIPKVVGSLITEVGESLIGIIRSGGLAIMDIMDYYNDENLKAKRQKMASMYMSLSYANLYEGLGYEAVIDDNGEITDIRKKSTTEGLESLVDADHIGDTINRGVGIVDSMFFGGKTTQGKVEKARVWTDMIADTIEEHGRNLAATVMDVIDIIADPQIEAKRKKLLELYLQAMYGQLISGMGFGVEYNDNGDLILKDKNTLGQAADLIKDGAEEIYTAFQTGGLNIMIEEFTEVGTAAVTQIAGMIRSIGDLFSLGEENAKEVKKYAALYMQAYYAKLIKGFGFGVDYENVRLKDLSAGEQAYNEIMGGFIETAASNLVSGVGSVITGIVAIIESIKDISNLPTDIQYEVKKYAGLYMKSYYSSLIYSMGFGIDFTNEQLSGLREEISDDYKSEVRTVVKGRLLQSTADKLAAFTLAEDEESKGIATKYSRIFMEAYYISLLGSMGMLKDPTTGEWYMSPDAEITPQKGWAQKLWEGATGDDDQKVINNIMSAVKSQAKALSLSAIEFINASDLAPAYTGFISAYVSSMSEDISKNSSNWMPDKDTAEDLSVALFSNATFKVGEITATDKFKNSFNSFLETWIEDQQISIEKHDDYWRPPQGKAENMTMAIMDNITSSLTGISLNSGSQSSFNTFMSSYFGKMNTDVGNNFTSWITDDTKKDFSKSVLDSIRMSFTAEGIQTTINNNSKDYTEMLAGIGAKLRDVSNELSGILKNINEKVVPDVQTIAQNSSNEPVYNSAAGITSDWVASEIPQQKVAEG